MIGALVAFVTALSPASAAADPGPPRPVLRSGADRLVAARGSFCWADPPDAEGRQRMVCADGPLRVPARALRIGPGLRVSVALRTATDSLSAWIRGRSKRLLVRRVDERRFVVRLPAQVDRDRPVLHLLARYPRGSGVFGARLRLP